jgi:hypothetical protein
VKYVKLSASAAFYIFKLYSAQGWPGVVANLKTSLVLIQQAIGGYIIDDQTELKRRVTRARSGLPKWIPVQARIDLLRGDVRAVRFWTSLCALYRVLEIPGVLNIRSITDSSSFNSSYWWAHYGSAFKVVLDTFWTRFIDISNLRETVRNWRFKPFPIGQSGPTTGHVSDTPGDPTFNSSSAYAVIKAARVWMAHPGLLSALTIYAGSAFVSTLEILALQWHSMLDEVPEGSLMRTTDGYDVSH